MYLLPNTILNQFKLRQLRIVSVIVEYIRALSLTQIVREMK